VRHIREKLPEDADPVIAAHLNVVAQIEHLMTYPQIKERVERGTLRVHAWFFDIATGDLEEWDPAEKRFVPLGSASLHKVSC
jgi:carbonic anhydrase